MTTAKNLTTVADFLARRDIPELTTETIPKSVDMLAFMPNGLIEPIYVAAAAMKANLAQRLLISGGIGHSTQALRDTIHSHPQFGSVETKDRTEADILHDIFTGHLGIPSEQIIVENESTNCGENAQKSLSVSHSLGITVRSLLLIQDPTMQRRTHACFERAWKDEAVNITSFAPFVPRVYGPESGLQIGGSKEAVWPLERFISLTLGEIPRLRDDKDGYGPKGRDFIDHVEIPANVMQAYEELVEDFSSLERKALS